ncbi:hypothetical protein KY285_007804 [Solanum tuberosum]|nr:hypothetical protein KY285_007804 [Solanum tuberosum]
MELVGPDGQIGNFQGQTIPGSGKPPTSVKTLAMEPVGPDGKTSPFSRSNDPRAGNPPFCRFSCTIVNGSFRDPFFRRHLCQNISWTSIKTLAMEPVDPDWQTGPFAMSN